MSNTLGTWAEWSGFAALTLMLILSLVSNGLALLIFCIRPSLRTISNRFVMNLLVGNLACSAVLGSLLLVDRAPPSSVVVESFRSSPCAFAEGASALFCLLSVLGVLLVATDQYLAVIDPLRYRAKVGNAKSLLMVAAQWIFSGIFAVLFAVSPSSSPSPWSFCDNKNDIGLFTEDSNMYKSVLSVVYLIAVVVAVGLICTMYLRISVAAKKSAKPPAPSPASISSKVDAESGDSKSKEECVSLLLGCEKKTSPSELRKPYLSRSLKNVFLVDGTKNIPVNFKFIYEKGKVHSHDNLFEMAQTKTDTDNGLKTVRSSPNFGSMECQPPSSTPSRSPSYMSSLRCRISNASLFKYKEESRAARISVMVVVLALGCQLPAAIMQVVPSFGTIPLIFLCLGGAVSPFLFVYRSRRVKNELLRICRRKPDDDLPNRNSLRRASSQSTEKSWRGNKNSSHTALKILHALAMEKDVPEKLPPVILTCPPGKSILKRVRAQSKRWSRSKQRCKFAKQESKDPEPGLKGVRRGSITKISRSLDSKDFRAGNVRRTSLSKISKSTFTLETR